MLKEGFGYRVRNQNCGAVKVKLILTSNKSRITIDKSNDQLLESILNC